MASGGTGEIEAGRGGPCAGTGWRDESGTGRPGPRRSTIGMLINRIQRQPRYWVMIPPAKTPAAPPAPFMAPHKADRPEALRAGGEGGVDDREREPSAMTAPHGP